MGDIDSYVLGVWKNCSNDKNYLWSYYDFSFLFL